MHFVNWPMTEHISLIQLDTVENKECPSRLNKYEEISKNIIQDLAEKLMYLETNGMQPQHIYDLPSNPKCLSHH